MLISIDTYRIFDFPGGRGPNTPLDPRMRMIDHLRYPNFQVFRKDNTDGQCHDFSCNGSFSIPGASADTSKHDEVYDSAIFWWKTNLLGPRTLVRVETQ